MILNAVLLTIFVRLVISTAHKNILSLDIYGGDSFLAEMASDINVRRFLGFLLRRFGGLSSISDMQNNLWSRPVRILLFPHGRTSLWTTHSWHRGWWWRG